VVADDSTMAPDAFTRSTSALSGRPKWKLTTAGLSSSTSAHCASPKDGMLTEEGIEAFARVLDGRWPEIVVATRDLARIIEENKAITISGKLDQLNEERTAQPAHARPNINTPYVAPQTETERTIAQIWQQLLGIEKVGVDDNFFELGGDSVLTIQIVAKTNKAGLKLTPQQVFEHQTIAALAAVAGTGEVVMARQDVVTGAGVNDFRILLVNGDGADRLAIFIEYGFKRSTRIGGFPDAATGSSHIKNFCIFIIHTINGRDPPTHCAGSHLPGFHRSKGGRRYRCLGKGCATGQHA